MLEGLYRVDWKNLTHAHGSAGNVPGMILALASPKREDRLYGFELIRESVFVQGALFEASPYIVDYLNQLLGHPLFEEKPAVLVLLAQMADGTGPLDLLQRSGLASMDESDPRVREQLAAERVWVELTRQALESGYALYLRSLVHADPEERSAAAYLVSRLSDSGGRLKEALLSRLHVEPEVPVRASLLFALGRYAAADTNLRIAIEGYGDQGVHPLLRSAALMTTARIAGEQTGESVRIGLVDLLSSLDAGLPQAYAALPWAEGHLFADIAICLCGTDPAQAHLVIPDLIRVLDRVPPQSALTLAYAMLVLAFGSRIGRAKFSGLQEAVLEAITDSVSLAQVPHATRRLMEMFDWE